MGSPSVRVEVVPVANKPRYEKTLIGQIFSSDDKDPPLSTKSPMVIRARPEAQPEPNPNLNKVDAKRPETRVMTPEPVQRNVSPLQPHSGPGSLERASPTPTAGSAGSSPTPKTTNYNQSPLASKNSAVPGLSNLTNKKGGKRIKIDLKKGKNNCYVDVLLHVSNSRLWVISICPTKSPIWCNVTRHLKGEGWYLSCPEEGYVSCLVKAKLETSELFMLMWPSVKMNMRPMLLSVCGKLFWPSQLNCLNNLLYF